VYDKNRSLTAEEAKKHTVGVGTMWKHVIDCVGVVGIHGRSETDYSLQNKKDRLMHQLRYGDIHAKSARYSCLVLLTILDEISKNSSNIQLINKAEETYDKIKSVNPVNK
jgi:hypothetical protein